MLSFIAPDALTTNPIACPNCLIKRLVKAEYIEDIDMRIVRWYHENEDYCEDIISNEYYSTNKDNQYFDILRSAFNMHI